MKKLPLWDTLGWSVLGLFTPGEVRELTRDGMVTLRCRKCGRADVASRGWLPRKFDDVERWLTWLDTVPTSRHCAGPHVLELHATPEFRLVPTRSTPARNHRDALLFVAIGDKRLPTHQDFRAVIVRPTLQDQVYDQLVRG